MSHVPHALADEFPDHAEALSRLKSDDAHAARLFDEYHEVNRLVHRGETDVEPMSDPHLTELRKRRMALKDEVYALLKARGDAAVG
ncbi:YdcH family protein [Poseidonocella sedimentorum]|uniref:DUF465 domain-containing protein n=1 Tax=Poseidonocella sedimentorum TaxID=871652 RepID=A0A1I6DS13_9RHOB|nr:DUF465 domain-containing protein [Poseidonocella sedimentorum]SFR08253.1 hypothetical protein SAMN04515673_10530 [Poseidonocella sedimentorum]